MTEPLEDETELVPLPPQRVLLRALALSGVVCRGFLEQDSGNPAADQFRVRVCGWLRQGGVWCGRSLNSRRLYYWRLSLA